MKFLYAIVISCCLSFSAIAEDEDLPAMAREINRIDCNNTESGIEDRECFIKGYPEAEMELNKTYQSAAKCLSAENLANLRKTENGWIKYRDGNAELEAYTDRFAQMHNAEIMAAKRDMDKVRILELKKIIAVDCNDD